MTTIHLVDMNRKVMEAWMRAFKSAEFPNISITHGSILSIPADVWVTPTNSRGHMSGGVDAVIKNCLGDYIEEYLQSEIVARHGGYLPVGHAVLIPTQGDTPKYVVATPTMEGESDNIRRTKNTALACAAAFQAVYGAQEDAASVIHSVAIPGLGAGTGKVDPDVCASLMKIGYTLFRRKRYETFQEMLEHLNEELMKEGHTEAAEMSPPKETFTHSDEFPPEIAVAGKPKKGKKAKLVPTQDENHQVPEYNIGTAI